LWTLDPNQKHLTHTLLRRRTSKYLLRGRAGSRSKANPLHQCNVFEAGDFAAFDQIDICAIRTCMNKDRRSMMVLRMSCFMVISFLSTAGLWYNDAAAATSRSSSRVCDQSRCPHPRDHAIRIVASQSHRWGNDASFWARISADLNCCQAPPRRFYGYAYGAEISISFDAPLSTPPRYAR
jgi:hypothetical protein